MADLTKMSVEELLARIVSTYQSMSPGPYQWGIIPSDSDQAKYVADLFAHGSGDVHMVILPQHPGSVIGDDPMRPEHAIHLCVTGNGPSSEANARGLVEILTLIGHITRRTEVWKGHAVVARLGDYDGVLDNLDIPEVWSGCLNDICNGWVEIRRIEKPAALAAKGVER